MMMTWLGTLRIAFLLYCWRNADLQPFNTTSDQASEMPPNAKTQDMPGVFDEILVQEILEPNKTKLTKTQSTATMLSTMTTKDKSSAVEEGSQADASETYHELLEHLQFSTGSEDKTSNNEVSTDENAHTGVTAETYHEPQLSSTEKKNSKDDPYYKLSDLDKILQNVGRSPGNTFQ
ncbi:sperm acrosome-associated protein 7 isoform X1 [Ochotona curzoniae]|uniref:sperm acrosome-associated protein 7 isoform X1 n=1 Tax=Ochotona curzoniae TaxID=130825 RepID=UPI001B34F681|nr:sperm acrosome-associated protein 7 isoform X1 [Ochotona curzoniae]